MLSYQTQYMDNVREIASLCDFHRVSTADFDSWYGEQQRAARRIEALRKENMSLLSDFLFPRLDDLHRAGPEDIAQLEEFADALMDWKTNLDCGVYLLIHDSLLSLYRIRKDRNLIIKELYKLGMGLYYQNRTVQGVEREWTNSFYFRNEMVFTEAGSYLKFFEEIDDEETKGYIVRSLANIAICSLDKKKRVSISARILKIVQDPYYRALAPTLPWDVFLRRTHQQMSSNRSILSKGNLSSEELAAVLESCQVVFEPEKNTENPNVRWLWPYYEMEYSCGFVDLKTTLNRMERLISRAEYDQYDMSGLYANIQLPIYYGRLVRDYPALQEKPRVMQFLSYAYGKMMQALLSFPLEQLNDFFLYCIALVISDYYETEGVQSYREITTRIMQRVTGRLYIHSRRVGDLLKLLCAAIYRSDSSFFDDIDFLREIRDPEEKEKALLEYAAQCGLYHDFGLIKMDLERLSRTRDLFEGEFRLFKLHTNSGYDDLIKRSSTVIFADIAHGHHSWYNGSGGYPDSYVRTQSPYRQMTDVVAVAAYLANHYRGDLDETVSSVLALERKRFSPIVTSFLNDKALLENLKSVFQSGDEPYYRELYRQLTASSAVS